MNNLITNFEQILTFAQDTGVPLTKKRGIIREYLQTKLIDLIYTQVLSKKMSFVGGTALRLLRGIDRFSEDLDFDNLGLSERQIAGLVMEAVEKFKRENIEVELTRQEKETRTCFQLKFPRLLFDLKVSSNEREKLMIKIDYSTLWKEQQPETIFLHQYGMVQSVVTNPINQLLVQKLAAYALRKTTQPRDAYDVVWLYAQGARLDRTFMAKNKLEDLVTRAGEKLKRESISSNFRQRLKPFLFSEDSCSKLNLLADVLESLHVNDG